MKKLTKEWYKDFEFHDLIVALNPSSDKKIPFIFLNGGEENVAKEDLYMEKANLNVTDKENEIKFVMLPETMELDFDYLGDGEVINETTCKNDFLLQYWNMLRVISYLPDDILKSVKDKRLLALGYTERETKQKILEYIKEKYEKAFDLYEDCCEASINAERGLTIYKQFETHSYIHSVPFLFDGAEITKAEIINGEIRLTLDKNISVVFSGAEVIEEEADILNSCVMATELYKKKNGHELHFLIMKMDENLIYNYYYAAFAFKDLKFEY